jgi:hypothetical protein
MSDVSTPDLRSMPVGEPSSLPMFYKSPRPVERERDAGLYVSRPNNFLFAAKTNAIPILVDEFPIASAHYPIVFAAGPRPIPAVVVGLRNDENSFVDATGRWLADSYLPAYVRRYPFIFMASEDGSQYVLCVDDSSDLLGEQGDYPLFEGREPSRFTQSAMEFCAALRQQGEATDEFVEALVESDLLDRFDAQLTTAEGNIKLQGFLTISPKKFEALPNKTVLKWKSKGWLSLIYAHLLSSHRWSALSALDLRNSSA